MVCPPTTALNMLFYIKRKLKKYEGWIVGLGAVLIGLAVYLARRASEEKRRISVAVSRARVEVALFSARQDAKNGAEEALEAIEAEHKDKIAAIDKTAAAIETAAGDSRAALAALINRSFRR